MASWVKLPDASYVQGSQIILVYVQAMPEGGAVIALQDANDRTHFRGKPDGTNYPDVAAAQAAMDTAIVNLGGSI